MIALGRSRSLGLILAGLLSVPLGLLADRWTWHRLTRGD